MFWLLLLVAAAAAAGGGGPPRRTPKFPKLIGQKIGPEANESPLAGFSDAQPVYIKSQGRHWFYVGACLDDWTDDLRDICQEETGSGCGEKALEIVTRVLEWYGAGVTAIADWLEARLCLRLKAKLRLYRLDGERYWSVGWQEKGQKIQLWNGEIADPIEVMQTELERAAPMTLGPKDGYKRAWILPHWPTGTRNENALMVFWPSWEEGGPVLQELVPEQDLRAMILLLSRTGAFTRQDLDAIDGAPHKWRPATLAQVKNEYPGIR